MPHVRLHVRSVLRDERSRPREECRLEVDETRERDAPKEGEGLQHDLLQVAPNMAGGSDLQATSKEEEERIVERAQDLREIVE